MTPGARSDLEWLRDARRFEPELNIIGRSALEEIDSLTARVKELEARLAAVVALCELAIADDLAEYASVLAQDVLRAAEGK